MAVNEYRLLIAEVFELAGLSRRTSEVMAREVGLSAARWHVMSVIADAAMTAPQVARRLGMTRQSVHRVVDELAAEGFVQLLANPDHRRSALVALTDRGRAALGSLSARSGDRRAELLARAGISAGELDAARKTIRRLIDAVATDVPHDTGLARRAGPVPVP